MTNLSQRFEAKFVRRGIDECWLWTGSIQKSTGYGKIGKGPAGSGWEYAHRVAWRLSNGEIPPGLCVLHRCDNRPCVNPRHLFLGSKADNAADRNRKGRTKAGRPSPGEANGRAKLAAADVDRVRLLYGLGGRSMASLGREFGVSHTQVQRVLSKENWATKQESEHG
jgi:hypothetical protein